MTFDIFAYTIVFIMIDYGINIINDDSIDDMDYNNNIDYDDITFIDTLMLIIIIIIKL